MATGRKREKPPKKPRSRKKPVSRLSQAEADDLALAEELLRTSRHEQAAFAAGWNQFMNDLGIRRKKPIGAKKLQEMALREGINPEANEFSRGILEMREE